MNKLTRYLTREIRDIDAARSEIARLKTQNGALVISGFVALVLAVVAAFALADSDEGEITCEGDERKLVVVDRTVGLSDGAEGGDDDAGDEGKRSETIAVTIGDCEELDGEVLTDLVTALVPATTATTTTTTTTVVSTADTTETTVATDPDAPADD